MPHCALITKVSWADLGKHFWSLLQIRSLRPAILLVWDCHWRRRGEGKALLEIQLVLHKEWCTWKIDHDTALRQILLIIQYLNIQYIPLNDEKKPKVTANKSHSNETNRRGENFSSGSLHNSFPYTYHIAEWAVFLLRKGAEPFSIGIFQTTRQFQKGAEPKGTNPPFLNLIFKMEIIIPKKMGLLKGLDHLCICRVKYTVISL